jgi:hypothetical protein
MKTIGLVAAMLGASCVVHEPPAPAAPAPMCLPVVITTDSLMVAAYPGPCDRREPPDTLRVWKIPSQLPWCRFTGMVDLGKDELRVQWTDCRAPVRFGQT